MKDLRQRATERLTNKLKDLNEQLGKELDNYNFDTFDALALEVKKVEKELQDLRLKEKVQRINKREAERREIAKIIWNIGVLPTNLITADGKPHKVKIKADKYASLRELMEDKKYSVYFEISDYDFVKYRIYNHKNRNSFVYSVQTEDYEKSKHNGHFFERHSKVYNSFDDMLKGCGIEPKPLKLSSVKRDIKKAVELSEKMKIQAEKYENQLKKFNPYFYEKEGIISRYDLRYTEIRKNLLK